MGRGVRGGETTQSETPSLRTVPAELILSQQAAGGLSPGPDRAAAAQSSRSMHAAAHCSGVASTSAGSFMRSAPATSWFAWKRQVTPVSAGGGGGGGGARAASLDGMQTVTPRLYCSGPALRLSQQADGGSSASPDSAAAAHHGVAAHSAQQLSRSMSSRGNSSPSPPLMSESARKVHVGGDAAATGFGAAGASSSLMPLRSAASASRISRTSSREWFRAAPRSAGVSSNAAGVVSASSTYARADAPASAASGRMASDALVVRIPTRDCTWTTTTSASSTVARASRTVACLQ